MGPMRIPENAHISETALNVNPPARSGATPQRRAPVLLSAVARSALPYSVRPKKRYSAAINATLVSTTSRLCTLMVMPPTSNDADENGGVREPSAPKNQRPRPVRTKCTATDTISSTSTLASASGWEGKGGKQGRGGGRTAESCASAGGWYAMRYNSGPRGVTSASVTRTCTQNGSSVDASHHDIAQM